MRETPSDHGLYAGDEPSNTVVAGIHAARRLLISLTTKCEISQKLQQFCVSLWSGTPRSTKGTEIGDRISRRAAVDALRLPTGKRENTGKPYFLRFTITSRKRTLPPPPVPPVQLSRSARAFSDRPNDRPFACRRVSLRTVPGRPRCRLAASGRR